jgi:hypothetical protein
LRPTVAVTTAATWRVYRLWTAVYAAVVTVMTTNVHDVGADMRVATAFDVSAADAGVARSM